MEGRRGFLKKLLAGAAWGALASQSSAFSAGTTNWGDFTARLRSLEDGDAFWTEIRQQFNFVKGQVYFNNATIGLLPHPVLALMQEKLQKLSSGHYSVEKSARERVAEMLGADVAEVSMTRNTTEGINIIAQGLRLRRGDEVIITDNEHVGNALPWLNRARRSGIKLRVFSPAPTGAETLNRISDLIGRRTRVIAVPHITCTTGQVLPAKEIATLARDKKVLSFFDGAHGPGMLFPQMREIGCDFYAACGHKWLCGPAGTGMLYISREKFERVEALMVGAYSDSGWEVSQDRVHLDGLVETGHRFDYGTQSNPQQVGLQAAIEFQQEIGFAKIRERGAFLAKYLQDKLLERSYIDMLTPTESASRGSIVGFKVRGKTLQEIRGWEHYPHFRIRLVPESGLDSVRISTHLYNLESDIDRFLVALDEFAG